MTHGSTQPTWIRNQCQFELASCQPVEIVRRTKKKKEPEEWNKQFEGHVPTQFVFLKAESPQATSLSINFLHKHVRNKFMASRNLFFRSLRLHVLPYLFFGTFFEGIKPGCGRQSCKIKTLT